MARSLNPFFLAGLGAGAAAAAIAATRALRSSPPPDGSVVVITGGSRGLGYAIASHFGRRPVRLVLASRDRLELATAQDSLLEEHPHLRPEDFYLVDANLADPAECKRLVNEAFARRFFKGQNPIGQHFGPDKIQYSSYYEIVGVVRDMRYMTGDYKEPVGPMFWLPEAQTVNYDDPNFRAGEIWSHFLYNIVIWAPGNPPGMEEQVRKALASVDPNLAFQGVDSYNKVLSGDFQQQNMIATLTTLFGVLGLILAAVGLYGVMAYNVEQRTSEIGLRMALGADRWQMVRMVLRGAFSQIGIGLALGIPAAIGAGKLMSDQLFGVRPWDPVMLASATLLLSLAALLASLIPARRAAGVEPMVALRNE